jgi:segregation and condensation protein B
MEESLSLNVESVVEGCAEAQESAAEPSAPPSDQALSDSRALKGILEALLFVTADPIPVSRFVTLLGAVTKQEVEQALDGLRHEYEQEGRGLQLAEVAGGYRIVTKAEFAPWLKRLEKVKAPSKLSRSALESLAIIAYKQPIVRAEVEQIRGVETSGVIRTLLERKLVRIVGRKEEPGRPIMYGTTKFFLEHFGLRDLSQLPPLREFKELGESEQVMLPIDESVEVGGMSSFQAVEAPAESVVEETVEAITLIETNGAACEAYKNGVVEGDAEQELMAADLVNES